MTAPGGRIEILVEPDLRAFPRRMAAEMRSAGESGAAALTVGTKKGLADAADVTAAAGRAAGRAYADGLVRDSAGRLRNARGQFASAMEIAAAGLDPVAEGAGRRTGGRLAQGINQSLTRNSPLIVAGVSAALAAGAPAVTVAAGTLMGGIGAVAAAQTLEVREAWSQLGTDIRDGAVADAAVLVPVYTRMADRMGAAVDGLRPQLRTAFAESAPLVEDLTDGVIALAMNAMPGLVRSVSDAEPVFEGLQSFLGSVGLGVTGFLDSISEHSPAAGEAFAALGRVLENMLPALGEILGQGAELAADVLPALADATGVAVDVLKTLGPLLPAVATGLLALKAARGAAATLDTLAVKLGDYAAKSGAAAGLAGNLSRGLGSVASAAGPAALGIGFAAAGLVAWVEAGQAAEEANRALGRAFRAGGDQAEAAGTYVQRFHERTGGLLVDLPGWVQNMGAFGYTIGDLIPTVEGATDSYDQWYQSLDAGARAQEDVTVATDALRRAVDEFGPTSNEAEGAARTLEAAQRSLAAAEGEVERAIHGVTQAMIAQSEQQLAAANSDLAYRMSVDATEGAVAGLAAAVREHGAASEEAADAALQVEQAMLRQAEAFGQAAADALPANTSEMQRNAAAQASTLAELLRLRDTMGDSFPASLHTTIAALQQSTDAGAVASAQFRQLGAEVIGVPNSKYVDVRSPAPEQIAQFERLGFRIEHLPDGNVRLHAETAAAEYALNQTARNRESVVTQRVRVLREQVAVTGRHTGVAAASGGYIRGPGTGTSDSIPAWLSNGEYVTRAMMTAAVGRPGMDAVNRGDWAAAAARFTELAERQVRFTAVAQGGSRAAAAAGRFAAGGYVAAQPSRSGSVAAAAPPPVVQHVHPSPGMDEQRLADAAVRRLEMQARTGRV
ncbi:hypothetical protein [Blastococcus xanthinilyticus]|uniref:Phage-related protein n=1 Tax=Blastococcus xanthinilyticus TaxID=1564164 RepID=A0A5S5CXY9_9ACTN|nr:hypothetical protein [Blastococcus xanthinilyticus]TYP88435.1 hypothetical protein BD833_104139 [Blastococcus xanthinilyticus]